MLIIVITVWRETLAVGNIGEFTAKSIIIIWQKKIWRILSILRPKIMRTTYVIRLDSSVKIRNEQLQRGQ